MAIVLFAIIGATIKAGVGYWICFGVFCSLKLIEMIDKGVKAWREYND